MSNYGKFVAETTDRYFAALEAAQESFLKSVATFSAAMPAAPLAFQPAMQGLPTVQEVSEATFAFAQKLLNQQQSFVQKLIATTPGEGSTAPAVAFGKTVTPKTKNAN
jgi:hypothetical protein